MRFCLEQKNDNGQWIVGYLYRLSERLNPFIMLQNSSGEAYEVIPNTVGQYIGKSDCDGTKIFEGDIVYYDFASIYAVIGYDPECPRFTIKTKDVLIDFYKFVSDDVKVVGNIFDNPELLKEVNANENNLYNRN